MLTFGLTVFPTFFAYVSRLGLTFFAYVWPLGITFFAHVCLPFNPWL